MSAPTTETRTAVYARDSYRCVACNAHDGLTFQHRRAVGMGGSRIPPSVVDGLVLCATCNEACEHAMQTLALAYGWKARKWTDPTLVPVYYPHERRWYRLEGIGRVPVASIVALDMMHAVYGDEYLRWQQKERI